MPNCKWCGVEFAYKPRKTACSKRCNWQYWTNRNKEFMDSGSLKPGERFYGKMPKTLEIQIWYEAIKSNPCTDCGNKFPTCCMDFDHISEDKTAKIGQLATHCTDKQIIQEEIDKCELVCANCHRIRTSRRAIAKKLEKKGSRIKT